LRSSTPYLKLSPSTRNSTTEYSSRFPPPPNFGNYLVQLQLRKLLESAAGDAGIVGTHLGFRALPEYDFRIADVAYVSQERWDRIDLEDNLHGAPDLVAEILSGSITVSEIAKEKRLCLENGCREFWVLDADVRQVEVSTPDGITTTYRDGQEIPLLFGSGTLKVNDIFA
jgi:Uma2 family endonuclease